MTSSFPPTPDARGADELGNSLTLGILHESILALGGVDDLASLWPVVCDRARWVVPCNRVAVVVAEADGWSAVVRSERGQRLDPIGVDHADDRLARALASSEPSWLDGVDPADGFRSWLGEDAPGGVLVVPLTGEAEPKAGLTFSVAALGASDRRLVTAMVGLFGQHVAMAHRLIGANSELRSQGRRIGTLIDLTPDAIVVVDRGGKIVQTTARMADLFGYQPDDVVGRAVELLVPDELRDVHVRHRGRFAADPQRRPMGPELDLRARRADGSTFPVEISLAPIPGDEQGLVMAAVRDVSEQHRAKAIASLLQSVVLASNRTMEPDDAFAVAIDEICAFTGWPVGHAYVVSGSGELEPTDVWHVEGAGFERFREVTMRTTFAPSDGLPGRVVATGSPAVVRDLRVDPTFVRGRHEEVGVAGAFAFPVWVGTEVVAVLEFFSAEPSEVDRDVLDALAQAGTQVGRVIERARARAQMHAHAEELERSNRELEQFARVASHDLQEPLRMVTGYLQLLDRRYAEVLDDDAVEFIGYAADGASRMQDLIQALLDYSRVGTKAGELETVDAGVALADVVSNLKASIEEAGATVTSDELPVMQAEPVQFRQLLQNLIANAIKFRSTVAPSVHVSARRDDATWIFEIRDNGIGIAPEFHDRVFAVFQRLHTRSEYEGTGMGLSICQKIVERHGGRIWVDSEQGTGSTFAFSWPEGQR